MRLDTHQFRGNELDITDRELPNSKYLLFRGDKLNMTTKGSDEGLKMKFGH